MAEKSKEPTPCPRKFRDGAECDGKLVVVDDNRIEIRFRCSKCGRNYSVTKK